VVVVRRLDLDRGAHPRVDQALELDGAAGIEAREHARLPGDQAAVDGDLLEVHAVHRGRLAVVEGAAAVAELVHFGERVELAALVAHLDGAAGVEAELGTAEVPLVDRARVAELVEQLLEQRLPVADARPRPDRRLERRRIAVVLHLDHAVIGRAERGRRQHQQGHDRQRDRQRRCTTPRTSHGLPSLAADAAAAPARPDVGVRAILSDRGQARQW
jgi:hypothetical protein